VRPKKSPFTWVLLLALLLQSVNVGPYPSPASAVLTCAQGGVCVVGNTGPGGGIVFYVATSPFTATGAPCSTSCRYLEVAPTSGANPWSDVTSAWTGATRVLMGTTGDAIGRGYANTQAMVGLSSSGAGPMPGAYRGPSNLSDWYLPSKDEIYQLWIQRSVVGMTNNLRYWSSSEQKTDAAWSKQFNSSASFLSTGKENTTVYVRPIRAFSTANTSNPITITSSPRASNYVGETYTASATAPGGTVAISIDASTSSRCSIGVNNVVSFTSLGSCLINFNQAGNTTYAAASQAQQSITIIEKTSNPITITSSPRASNYVGETYTASATAPGGTVAISIDASTSSRCSIGVNNVVSFTSLGSCLINFNQAGNTTYAAASQAQQSITITEIAAPVVVISTGAKANSQVATIPDGVNNVIIPAIDALPATTLNFEDSAPTAVTVSLVSTNSVVAAVTPFSISATTKIIEIEISGTFNGSATVCLDGAETDNLYHFKDGSWGELPSRTYVDGQVCGVTTNFSKFVAAPTAPVSLKVSSSADDLAATQAALKAAAEAAEKAAAEAAAAKREAEKQAARGEITTKLLGAQELSVELFAKAEISGITESNIAAFQSELLALPEESRVDINQILKVAYKFEVVGNIGSDRVNYMQSNTFIALGLIPAESKNKVSLVYAIRKLSASSRDTYAEIKVAIEAHAASLQARRDRLAAVIARNAARYGK
jgi:hypothetical protein